MDVGIQVDQHLNKFILISLFIVAESFQKRLEASLSTTLAAWR
jgi:hypothetical protein